MQIVIDLPECWEKCNIRFIKERIRNGTLLPKGHGRLIDADALFEKFEEAGWFNNADRDDVAEKILLDAPTIIEADKEVDE